MFLVVLDFRKLIRKISELHDFKGDISQKPKKKKIYVWECGYGCF
jgi:hypothetical protein